MQFCSEDSFRIVLGLCTGVQLFYIYRLMPLPWENHQQRMDTSFLSPSVNTVYTNIVCPFLRAWRRVFRSTLLFADTTIFWLHVLLKKQRGDFLSFSLESHFLGKTQIFRYFISFYSSHLCPFPQINSILPPT